MEKGLDSANISTLTGFKQEMIDSFLKDFTNPKTEPIEGSELMFPA